MAVGWHFIAYSWAATKASNTPVLETIVDSRIKYARTTNEISGFFSTQALLIFNLRLLQRELSTMLRKLEFN